MILSAIDGVTATSLLEKKLNSYGDVRSILRSLEIAGLIKSTAVSVKQVRFNMEFKESKSADLAPHNRVEKISDEPANTPNHDSSTHHRNPANLAVAVNEMSVFILTHLPEQSFQILKEIEEISSLEMLAATLGGYEQIISHLGEKSAQHLRDINTTLGARL